jgi:ATP-binding cassette subfamily A (ABC1) protein 3
MLTGLYQAARGTA